jgi:CheY-like chemotaxis protein
MARRIKADPALKDVPIIVVTAYALSGSDRRRRVRLVAMTSSPNLSVRVNC